MSGCTSDEEVGEEVEDADVEGGEEEVVEGVDVDDLHEGVEGWLHAWGSH